MRTVARSVGLFVLLQISLSYSGQGSDFPYVTTNGVKWTYTCEWGSACIRGISATPADSSSMVVECPEVLDGYPVFRIASYGGIRRVSRFVIPPRLVHIDSGAFSRVAIDAFEVKDGSAWFSVHDGVLYDRDVTTLFSVPTGFKGEYRVPSTVRQIRSGAFEIATNVTRIVIPKGVECVGARFGNCPHLKAIDVDEANESYTSVDGVLYDKGMRTLIAVPSGRTGGLNIPETVVKLDTDAFYGYQLPSDFHIPSTVERISGRLRLGREKGPFVIDGCLLGWSSGKYGYNETPSNLVLDASVRLVATGVFQGDEILRTVVLPRGLRDIGPGTFERCSQLERVELPVGLTNIAAYAFHDCAALREIVIPEGVKTIGDHAFEGCKGLVSVKLPNTIEYIGTSAFARCPALGDGVIIENGCVLCINGGRPRDLVVPEGVRLIVPGALKGQGRIESLSLPRSLEDFDGHGIFDGCGIIKSLRVPVCASDLRRVFGDVGLVEKVEFLPGVTNVSGLGDSRLMDVTIPESVMSIDPYAFAECHHLQRVRLPSMLVRIGKRAFANSGLVRLEIPESVREIGDEAFRGCLALRSITFPAGLQKIGECVLDNCGTAVFSNLEPVPVPRCMEIISSDWPHGKDTEGGVLFSQRACVCRQWEKDGVTGDTYVIPEGVQRVADGVFSKNERPMRIVLPRSVRDFSTMIPVRNIESIELEEGNAALRIENNCLLRGDVLVHFLCRTASVARIPVGVRRIAPRAFYEATSLESVIIPAGVTNLGWAAFFNCSKLRKIVLPDGITEIGERCFDECVALKDLSLPKGLERMGYAAFRKCRSLEEVSIPDSLHEIPEQAFNGCDNIERLRLPSTLRRVGRRAFYGLKRIERMEWPQELESVGENAFPWGVLVKPLEKREIVSGNCVVDRHNNGVGATVTRLIPHAKEYHIPEGVNVVRFCGAEQCGCVDLRSVKIPSSVLHIDAWSGEDVRLLIEKSSFPDGIVSVDGCVFGVKGTCPETLILPKGTRLIADCAFFDCKNLRRLVLPPSVAHGGMTFRGCDNLESIEMPYALASKLDFDCHPRKNGAVSWTITDPVEEIEMGNIRGNDRIPYEYRTRSGVWKLVASLTIPSGVRRIGDGAFKSCVNLKSAAIPESVKSIGRDAFCPAFTAAGDWLLALPDDGKVPDGIRHVADGVLNEKSVSKNELKIPDSVESVGDSRGEWKGTNMVVCDGWVLQGPGERNRRVSSSSRLRYWNVRESANRECVHMVILKGVRGIADCAFKDSSSIRTVVIPEGVRQIGRETFCGCSSLEDVLLPSSIQCIDATAFANCPRLKLVLTPDVGAHHPWESMFANVEVRRFDQTLMPDVSSAENPVKTLQTLMHNREAEAIKGDLERLFVRFKEEFCDLGSYPTTAESFDPFAVISNFCQKSGCVFVTKDAQERFGHWCRGQGKILYELNHDCSAHSLYDRGFADSEIPHGRIVPSADVSRTNYFAFSRCASSNAVKEYDEDGQFVALHDSPWDLPGMDEAFAEACAPYVAAQEAWLKARGLNSVGELESRYKSVRSCLQAVSDLADWVGMRLTNSLYVGMTDVDFRTGRRNEARIQYVGPGRRRLVGFDSRGSSEIKDLHERISKWRTENGSLQEMSSGENGRVGVSRSTGLNLSQGGSLRARRLQRKQEAAAAQAKAAAAAAEREVARETERRALTDQEKAQREAELAEQRAQLLAIREELKRVREAKAAAAEKQKGK